MSEGGSNFGSPSTVILLHLPHLFSLIFQLLLPLSFPLPSHPPPPTPSLSFLLILLPLLPILLLLLLLLLPLLLRIDSWPQLRSLLVQLSGRQCGVSSHRRCYCDIDNIVI